MRRRLAAGAHVPASADHASASGRRSRSCRTAALPLEVDGRRPPPPTACTSRSCPEPSASWSEPAGTIADLRPPRRTGGRRPGTGTSPPSHAVRGRSTSPPTRQAILRPYFTNLDGPVFALVNLPEVVKGALFARYSRSRQEPAPALPRRVRRRPRPHRRPHRRRHRRPEAAPRSSTTGCSSSTATTPSRSSAACTSRASRRRTCSPRSSSGAGSWPTSSSRRATSPYDTRLGGRYRYYRDRRGARVAARRALRRRHGRAVRHLRATAARAHDWARERYPKEPADSDFVYKQTIKAKACDAVRGILPAATLSNVGIYGTGQALRGAAAAHARAPAARGAAATPTLMLDELRKVIPSFLTRVDRPDRGGAWSAYLAETRARHRRRRRPALRRRDEPEPRARGDARSTSTPTARTRCSPRSATRTRTCPRTSCSTRVRAARRRRAGRAARARTSASASNRRHKPGRAFERTDYRFDVLADYGAFRDLQRHRMLTIEWQPLSPAHGYDVPDAGRRSRPRERVRRRDGTLGRALRRAARAVPRAGVVRGVARVPHALRDADERTRGDAPPRAAHRAAGPPVVPRGRQEMHRLIAEQAGHRAIAAAMRYVDHATTSSSGSPPSAPPRPAPRLRAEVQTPKKDPRQS